MPEPRQVHAGNIGPVEAARPDKRHASRLILFGAGGIPRINHVSPAGSPPPLDPPRSFLFEDFQSRNDEELDVLSRGPSRHPIAVQDIRHRHRRPEIDMFADHSFSLPKGCLETGSLDAFLSVEPVSFLSGFFGTNCQRLARAGGALFIARIVSLVLLRLFLFGVIRRQSVR